MNTKRSQPLEITDTFHADLRGWLQAHVTADMPWILIHADDGVIWGRREPDGTLLLSSDLFTAKSQFPSIAVDLRVQTLQQVRVFGSAGELLLWREGAGFRGRTIMDGANKSEHDWHEQYILWGTAVRQMTGFTLLEEGQQGPQHAVPIAVPARRRAALTVRHYVEPDDRGQAAVVLSRLVDLGLFENQKGS